MVLIWKRFIFEKYSFLKNGSDLKFIHFCKRKHRRNKWKTWKRKQKKKEKHIVFEKKEKHKWKQETDQRRNKWAGPSSCARGRNGGTNRPRDREQFPIFEHVRSEPYLAQTSSGLIARIRYEQKPNRIPYVAQIFMLFGNSQIQLIRGKKMGLPHWIRAGSGPLWPHIFSEMEVLPQSLHQNDAHIRFSFIKKQKSSHFTSKYINQLNLKPPI